MYQSLHDSIYTCIKSIYRAIYVILKDQMQVDIKTNANKKWYKKKIEIGLILSQGASDNTSWHETTSRSMVFSQIKKKTRNDIKKLEIGLPCTRDITCKLMYTALWCFTTFLL